MLEGLIFLHEHDIVHGKLTCESIYINSNNGEIKIGDIGIKHIYATNKGDFSNGTGKTTFTAESELGQSKWYLNERNTKKFDTFCFGLALLEIIFTEMAA